MAERKVLTQIAPAAWEHPADRAALNTLRSLPGFDEVVRKVAGLLGLLLRLLPKGTRLRIGLGMCWSAVLRWVPAVFRPTRAPTSPVLQVFRL